MSRTVGKALPSRLVRTRDQPPSARRPRPRWARSLGRAAKPVILLVLLVAGWQLVVSRHLIPSIALASPSDVASYLVHHKLQMLDNSGATLKEIAFAFLIAGVGGLLLGILVHESRLLHDALMPLLIITQVVPSIAIAPLLVLILGFGDTPKIATAAIIAFFPVLINTVTGLESLDEDAHDLALSLRASRLQRLRYFAIPTALPYVFAGARVAITLCVIGAVVGEFVTADHGLGYLILQGSSTLVPQLVFAALVVLAVIGLGLFGFVRALEYLLVPWARPIRGGKS